jgi:hypothetical protein
VTREMSYRGDETTSSLRDGGVQSGRCLNGFTKVVTVPAIAMLKLNREIVTETITRRFSDVMIPTARVGVLRTRLIEGTSAGR